MENLEIGASLRRFPGLKLGQVGQIIYTIINYS